MIKKILKIVGVFVLLIVVALFAIPYFFQDQIKAKIAQAINENVDANVSFADADLSLFKSFPKANVAIEKLLIINKAPFQGDTLVSLGELNLTMLIRELFKGKDEAMHIEGITSENGFINILFNKDGIGNFDIAIKDKPGKDDDVKSDPLSLKIKGYKIENFKFKYFDERSKMKMVIDSLNHSGSGDFTTSKLDLDTKTSARISLDMDKVNYMNKIPLTLDAILGIDLDKKIYIFKDNKAQISKMPLEFDGSIQLVDAGQDYNLTFKTPTSSFQNFLALIPAAYSGSIKDVKTTGDFTIAGFARGLYSDTIIPKFNVAIASHYASFKYPNLPKSVQNIVINTKIVNETGVLNDTYVNVERLSFKIDQDVFNAKASIKNIKENPLVDAVLKGTINLANISKAYPVKLDKPLSGILKADVTTNFDMKSVETNQYQNIRNAGTASLSQFKYTDDKGKALNISQAAVVFDPNHVNLQQFNATTGKTDLNVKGTLDNFYGFLFKKQELKGNFDLQSNQLAVSDFMTTETNTTSKTGTKTGKSNEAIKIPAFLNCTLTARINTVLYDNLVLKDASGRITVRDQKVNLENIKTSAFGGLIGMNGSVSTKEKTPNFTMNLDLSQVNIYQAFTQLEMLKKIAPIAGIIDGKLNSNIKLSGNLDAKQMTPDLKTITGNLFGQLLSTKLNASNSTLLSALGNNLKFIDLQKVNLDDIRTILTFSNGKVNVKPFDLKYQDIKVNIGGEHGFDQKMNYNVKFDVPAKYLGTEANALIAKLSLTDAAKMENIPINAILTGNFQNPKISTDIKQATTNLANQLVQRQKEKIINQGTSALGDLLNKNNPPKTDGTTPPKEEVKDKATSIINGIFNKKKKEEPKKE